MAQFVMVVTVGNSDSDVSMDIDYVAQELRDATDELVIRDNYGEMWPVTIRPLSEVIAC